VETFRSVVAVEDCCVEGNGEISSRRLNHALEALRYPYADITLFFEAGMYAAIFTHGSQVEDERAAAGRDYWGLPSWCSIVVPLSSEVILLPCSSGDGFVLAIVLIGVAEEEWW
jgi:hypothetical protein